MVPDVATAAVGCTLSLCSQLSREERSPLSCSSCPHTRHSTVDCAGQSGPPRPPSGQSLLTGVCWGWQLLRGRLTPTGPFLANPGQCKGQHFVPVRAVQTLDIPLGGGQPCIALWPFPRPRLVPPTCLPRPVPGSFPAGHTVSATASESPTCRADGCRVPQLVAVRVAQAMGQSDFGDEGGSLLCSSQMVECSSWLAEFSGVRGLPHGSSGPAPGVCCPSSCQPGPVLQDFFQQTCIFFTFFWACFHGLGCVFAAEICAVSA